MRNKKISADISIEAKNALDAYSDKHDRSKSWLINRMILKFCCDEAEPTKAAVVKPKAAVKRFMPPSVLTVETYMLEKGVHISKNSKDEAEKFCDHFESNGWKVGGKAKMKCWKAAVRNWLKGNNNGQSQKSSQKLSAHERVVERNNAKYRQSDECGLGMGANDGHLGRAVDEGERGATIEHMDSGTFIDYE